MTRRIALSGKLGAGRFALVDDEDFEWLSQYRWHFAARPSKTNKEQGYAARGQKKPDGSDDLVLMHRAIVIVGQGEEVDHIDGDGLNNTRVNLRKATRAQNARNRGSGPRRTLGIRSRYKGVFFHKRPVRRKPWSASIVMDRRRISLGYFETEVQAACAYDEAAKRLYGEFARLNIPPA